MTVEQAAAAAAGNLPSEAERESPKMGETRDEGTKEAPKEAEGKPAAPTVEQLAERLTKAEAERSELQNFAKGAVSRAERAEEYLQRMTASIQSAASRQQSNEPGMTLEERMQQDPLSVMDEHYRARTAPIVESVTRTQAALSQQLATQQWKGEKIPGTDRTVWDVYGKDLTEFMEKMPDAVRADATSYDAGLRWIRAQKIDDEIKMREEARAAKEQRGFSEGPSGGANRNAPKKGLSDLEKEVAKGLNMDSEEYVKWRDGAAEA